MRLQSSSPFFFLASLLPAFTAATGFDCAHIRVDGIEYDLSPLAGVHSLYHVEETEDLFMNTTYVLNICKPLKGAAIRGDLKCGTSKNSTFLSSPDPYVCGNTNVNLLNSLWIPKDQAS